MVVEIAVKLFLVAGIVCLVLLRTQLIPNIQFPEPELTSENVNTLEVENSPLSAAQCPEVVPQCEACPKCPVCPEPLHSDFENHQIMFSESTMLAVLERIKLAKNVHSVHIMFAGHSVHVAVAALHPLYLTAKALELCIENNGHMIKPKLNDSDLYARCVEPMARLLQREAGAGRAEDSFFYPDNIPPTAETALDADSAQSPVQQEEERKEEGNNRPMGKLQADSSHFDH